MVEKGGAALDAKDEGGDTALHEAARADDLEAGSYTRSHFSTTRARLSTV